MTQVTTSPSNPRKRERGASDSGSDTVQAISGRQEYRNKQMNQLQLGGETIPSTTVAADKRQSADFAGLKFVLDHDVWHRDRRLATEIAIKVS
jgi:hypothetical protein